jgi:hypothetical protein
MDNNKFSPPPVISADVVEELLTFPEAMSELIKGQTITRKAWNDGQEYALLADGWLTIHTKGNFHVWKVNDGDLTATDWMVING